MIHFSLVLNSTGMIQINLTITMQSIKWSVKIEWPFEEREKYTSSYQWKDFFCSELFISVFFCVLKIE